MGLEPLEFADCLTDSPIFRTKLQKHEKELEQTSKSIKNLIIDGKELLAAARNLAKAQRVFSQDLVEFNFECIGDNKTDDEMTIADALKEFGKLLGRIEDERERMLEKATEQFIKPLEVFRKQHIGNAKEGKKHFDKQTAKFCASLDRYLSLKTKINDNTFKEADATLHMERRGFYQASMKYVLQLQEVQERKKFEFVEIILGFMYSLLTFYHEGHETGADCGEYLRDVQLTLQKTREAFESTREQTENLMLKMLEGRGSFPETWREKRASAPPAVGGDYRPMDYVQQLMNAAKPMDQSGTLRGSWTRQGYLYLCEKKAIGTTWNKHWCCYKKEDKSFYMVPYNQSVGKVNHTGDTVKLLTCTRRASDTIERRFCFDITVEDRSGTLTFQALSEDDRKLWLDVMDGKEPVYTTPRKTTEDTALDNVGFDFIRRCVGAIESRGLEDQGLYRVVGVNSKVSKLIAMGLDRKKADKIALEDPASYEVKTITSAVKNYLRSLPEPLLTFKYHDAFITAAKHESKTLRLHDVHELVYQLPKRNFEMLDLLVGHLKRVAANCDKNLMTVANLGVCFGPTLMRPEEETVAAIMDIKFCNIVIEILITYYDRIFKNPPTDDMTDAKFTPTKLKATEDVPDVRSTPGRLNQFHFKTKSAPPPPGNNLSAAERPLSTYPNQLTMGNQSPRGDGPHYANQSVGLPYQQARSKLRPVDVYNPASGGFETQTGNSTSDSSDSLNSSQSNHVPSSPALSLQERKGYQGNQYKGGGGLPTPGQPVYSNINVADLANRLILSTSDVPTFGSIKKRTHCDTHSSMSTSMQGGTPGRTAPSMTGSVSGSLGGTPNSSNSRPKRPGRTVRTLYQCLAENTTELSFEPNMIINNVRSSKEPGWLEGTLQGKTGLIPENYVEFLD